MGVQGKPQIALEYARRVQPSGTFNTVDCIDASSVNALTRNYGSPAIQYCSHHGIWREPTPASLFCRCTRSLSESSCASSHSNLASWHLSLRWQKPTPASLSYPYLAIILTTFCSCCSTAGKCGTALIIVARVIACRTVTQQPCVANTVKADLWSVAWTCAVHITVRWRFKSSIIEIFR